MAKATYTDNNMKEVLADIESYIEQTEDTNEIALDKDYFGTDIVVTLNKTISIN